MKRPSFKLFFGFLFLLAMTSRVSGQEKVRFFDRKAKPPKEVTIIGVIQEESPARIRIKSSRGEARTIPVNNDLIDVEYQVSNVLSQDYRKAHNRELEYLKPTATPGEKNVALTEAIDLYQKLYPQLKDDKIKRHIQFKIAKLQADQAELDPSAASAAIDKLAAFKRDHPDSWQITWSARQLASLYAAKKDWDNALKTYQDLTKTAGVSSEIIQECDLAIAQVLVRAAKYDQAVAKLTELEKAVPSGTPQAVRLMITKATCLAATNKLDEAIKQLENIVAKTSDKDLVAAAYNAMGDCYRNASPSQPRAAMWDYLYVDLIYSQNPKEHAKAVYHLSRIFREFNDDKRSKIYEEKLAKDFSGVEFDRR
jgi:outer membrane protein assembly factor BamD (BamD/ComL family)